MTAYALDPSSGALVPVVERQPRTLPDVPVIECWDLSCDDDAMPGRTLCYAHARAALTTKRARTERARVIWERARESHAAAEMLARSFPETHRPWAAESHRRIAEKAARTEALWAARVEALDERIAEIDAETA